MAGSRPVEAAEALRSTADVRALTATRAEQQLPVELEGVLTFVNRAPFGVFGFVQQGDTGLYLRLDDAGSVPAAGRRVEIRGYSLAGEFAPSLHVLDIEDLGPGEPLTPATDDLDQLLTGAADSSWVSIEGIAQQMHHDPVGNLQVLSLRVHGDRVAVELPGSVDASAVEALVGSRIRARGVSGARFNAQRQLVGARVFVPDLEQLSVAVAGTGVEALPVRSIDSLLAFDKRNRADRLVRVQGVVTWVGDGTLVVEDASAGIVSSGLVGAAPQVGQQVDLVGYVQPGALSPALTDVRVRHTQAGVLPEALPVSELLELSLQQRRVRVAGRLLDAALGPQRATLTLSVGDRLLRVEVGAVDALAAAWTPGAQLSVEGVLMLSSDPIAPRYASADSLARVPDDAALFAVGPGDVTVEASAPFWTTDRAIKLSASLLLGLVIVVSWSVLLRRRVAAQTRVIREQLRRTEVLREQQLQGQRMQVIGELAGGVAHEFNNLLAAYGGNGHDLARSPDPAVRRIGEELVDLQGRGERLTRALLTYARRDARDDSVIELGALVTRMQPVLQRLLTARVHVEVQGGDEPAWVRLDAGQLEQVVLNLAINARDAMPDGGSLTLRVEAREDEAVLWVCDTGEGMTPEVSSKAFEPFFTTKPLGSGTGLGLSLVHGAVAGAGGRVQVESALGEGTAFRLSWPRQLEPARRPAAPAPAPVRAGTGQRVWLVDDDRAIRRVVRRLLERGGYEVVEIDSGETALALDERPALVVSDVLMPGMSGPEFLERLRQRQPGVPALLISGYPGEELDGDHLDGVAFLQKPFSPDAMLAQVAELLEPTAA